MIKKIFKITIVMPFGTAIAEVVNALQKDFQVETIDPCTTNEMVLELKNKE